MLKSKIKCINQFHPAQAAFATPHEVPLAPSMAALGPVLLLGVPALRRVHGSSPTSSQLQKSCSKVPQRISEKQHPFFDAEITQKKSVANPLTETELHMFFAPFLSLKKTYPGFQKSFNQAPCLPRYRSLPQPLPSEEMLVRLLML